MTIVLIPIAVCIVGLLLMLMASNTKAQRIGEIMFAAGLLVVLLAAPHGQVVIR